MVPPSGSVALKVYIVAVTFSLTVKSVLLVVVMTGGSFTSVTVTVTGRVAVEFLPSDARTEKLYNVVPARVGRTLVVRARS